MENSLRSGLVFKSFAFEEHGPPCLDKGKPGEQESSKGYKYQNEQCTAPFSQKSLRFQTIIQ